MVPKLHKKGTSFRGIAAYLLHDKDASTDERVEWTEVRNLAVDDPRLAWRIMAATAMDQDRLKAMAGVKASGRKSADSVLHYSLSWHTDEAPTLSREEMLRAAYGSIRALGAEDRQALIICHNDEKHPHIHIVINRVSAADGRMLSSSKEKLQLSQWAERYEKERGHIWCEERVLNNQARARKEFTRAARDKTRHIYETESRAGRAANDNREAAEKLRAELRAKDARLSQKSRDMNARHRSEREELARRHKARRAEIREASDKAKGQAKASVRADYRPHWRDLFRLHQNEVRQFEERESRLFGKITNVLKAIDHARLVRADERGSTIGNAFRFISSAGARREALERAHEKARTELLRQQNASIRLALRQVREERVRLLAESRGSFAIEGGDLRFRHRGDQALIRASWKTRTEDRTAAWSAFEKEADLRRQFESDWRNAAAREATHDRGGQSHAPGGEDRGQERSREPGDGQQNE